MSYIPRATGYPDYNSNSPAPSGFIPQLYEGKVIERLYEEQLITKITTTEYSGKIKGQGDSVVIAKAPPVDIVDYTIGQDLTPTQPTEIAVILTVDQAKAFFITVDDIDAYESHLDMMNIFADEAAKSLADTIDKEFFSWLASATLSSDNQGVNAGAKSHLYNLGDSSTPLVINADNALQTILAAAAVLDEQNVPRQGRWIVIPAAWSYFLKDSDLKSVCITGDGKSPLRLSDRSVGMVDSMEVFVSNNLHFNSTEGTFTCPFGDSKAIGYVNQITKTTTGELEKQFANYIKGLSVFGYEILDPKRIGKCVVSFS